MQAIFYFTLPTKVLGWWREDLTVFRSGGLAV